MGTMSVEQARRAILFVDIVGSVDMFSTSGDNAAAREIQTLIAAWIVIVERLGGTLVKSMGDGLLCTFESVDHACEAVSSMRQSNTQPRLYLHAGLHLGEVINHGADVYGQNVNLAARLANYAAPGEIVATEVVVEALSPLLRSQTRFLNNVMPKGMHETISVYQVVVGDSNLTQIGSTNTPQSNRVLKLVLYYGGQDYTMDTNITKLSLGREDDNDLCVDTSVVSRRHATIRHGVDEFILTDHSTNGTYLLSADGNVKAIKRDILGLPASGHISLGALPDKQPDALIEFQVQTSLAQG